MAYHMEEAAIYNNLTLCYLGVSGVYGLSAVLFHFTL
jgi:hypothetical protein